MKCLLELFTTFKMKRSRAIAIQTQAIDVLKIDISEFQVLNWQGAPIVLPLNRACIERESANNLIIHVPEQRTAISFLDLDCPPVRVEFVGALEPEDDKKRRQGKYSLKDFCTYQLKLPPQGSFLFELENKLPDNVTARVNWRS